MTSAIPCKCVCMYACVCVCVCVYWELDSFDIYYTYINECIYIYTLEMHDSIDRCQEKWICGSMSFQRVKSIQLPIYYIYYTYKYTRAHACMHVRARTLTQPTDSPTHSLSPSLSLALALSLALVLSRTYTLIGSTFSS